MLVGGKFAQIEAAKRQIGIAYGVAVLVNRENFKQTVRRDNRAVRCGQIFGSEQAKGNSGDFAVRTDSELGVLLQHLVKRNSGFLSLVVEAGRGFGDLDFLSRIDKLGGANISIQYHAVGRFNLSNFIFSEIQRFALGKSCFIGRYGINNFTLAVSGRAVGRDNILGGGDFIDCARQALNRENRLIHSVRFGHGRKDLAGFADLDSAFLRHIRFDDLNYGNTVLVACLVLRYIKIHGFAVQCIAVGGKDFDQRIPRTVF